jgi:ribosomal protein S19E (S16A)
MLFEGSVNAPEVVAERGTFTARRGKDVPQEHGKLPAKPGMVFPVHTLDGSVFYRLRPDNPGRLPKYMQPKGHPNRLDVHPRQHERIKQPGGMRYVTEGERKVDAGASHGLLMVGQSGVWNGTKDKELIPDWDLLPLEGEDYSICFDSDLLDNPLVQMAADRLARLLHERGARVFLTLLPSAPDGGKQGLDDFLAGGGTVKEVELLTRPYGSVDIGLVRLSRDEKLRLAVEDLTRRFWAEEWKGRGGHSERDLALKLVEAATRSGKLHADGIRVVASWGVLEVGAKVSRRTLSKSLTRLEERGFLYRDNEGRKADKTGAFVLRAKVYQYGGDGATEGKATQALRECVPGGIPSRAPLEGIPDVPRLRWSRPKFTPKRGTVSGTCKVRESKPQEPRDRIERLGKVRGAVVDALRVAGGELTERGLCEVLHRKRARDVRRRVLPMLEDAGVIRCEGDVVGLAADWRERLDEARDTGGELKADELAEDARKRKSRAYHSRRRSQAPVSRPSAAGMVAVQRSREMRYENIAAHEDHQAKARIAELERRSFVKRFVHDRLRSLGRIRLALLQEVVRDGGGTPSYALPAAKSLGCTVERLPEFGNEEFVFAPREWAA